MVEKPTPEVVIGGIGNIIGQNFNNVGNTTYIVQMGTDHDPLRVLGERIVPEAMHDSKDVVDQGTCHPGTRIAVLEDVTAWIEHLDPEFALMWMKGAAGAGKSAIARTLANRLADQGLLLGSFFCLRSNDRRSNASMVIPTLVDQILNHIPSVRPIIEEVLCRDPHLFTKSMEIQAMRLVVEPLASIEPERRRDLPRVIVVDGLDELKGAGAQCDILKTVAFLIDNLPFPIHFFITSRPEHQIQDYFTQHMDNRWSHILLDDTYRPDRDIVIFYKAHFSSIVAAFPAFKFEPDWPGEVARRVLVAKGSGQFIFADIVIRFVGSTSIAISPQRRLDMILANVSNDKLKPLELLDLVYVTVFDSAPKEELQDVLQLVGLVLLPVKFKKSAQVIDSVLCLEPGTTLNRLRYLHSILKVPSSPDKAIAPFHATLGDFVFNHDRSHSFGLHIDQGQFHQNIVLKILKGSMVQPASDWLNDCRDDWFGGLYHHPILKTFIHNPTFRTTFASHIREAQGRNISLWPPLALATTYRIALEALTPHSSWFDIKDYVSWRSLEKKRQKEVLRRLRLYVTDMGLTGQMLVFLQLVNWGRAEFGGGVAIRPLLMGLPDQNVLASQQLTGLGLPFADLPSDHPETKKVLSMFSNIFFDPTFLETLYTLLPSDLSLDLDGSPCTQFLQLIKILTTNEQLLRLIRLPALSPQNRPLIGSDETKVVFNRFLDLVLLERAKQKAMDQVRFAV